MQWSALLWLRVLPLLDVSNLAMGYFWRGKLGEIAQVFVDKRVERAQQIFATRSALRFHI